jgi:hypothetical protein
MFFIEDNPRVKRLELTNTYTKETYIALKITNPKFSVPHKFGPTPCFAIGPHEEFYYIYRLPARYRDLWMQKLNFAKYLIGIEPIYPRGTSIWYNSISAPPGEASEFDLPVYRKNVKLCMSLDRTISFYENISNWGELLGPDAKWSDPDQCWTWKDYYVIKNGIFRPKSMIASPKHIALEMQCLRPKIKALGHQYLIWCGHRSYLYEDGNRYVLAVSGRSDAELSNFIIEGCWHKDGYAYFWIKKNSGENAVARIRSQFASDQRMLATISNAINGLFYYNMSKHTAVNIMSFALQRVYESEPVGLMQNSSDMVELCCGQKRIYAIRTRDEWDKDVMYPSRARELERGLVQGELF